MTHHVHKLEDPRKEKNALTGVLDVTMQHLSIKNNLDKGNSNEDIEQFVHMLERLNIQHAQRS